MATGMLNVPKIRHHTKKNGKKYPLPYHPRIFFQTPLAFNESVGNSSFMGEDVVGPRSELYGSFPVFHFGNFIIQVDGVKGSLVFCGQHQGQL